MPSNAKVVAISQRVVEVPAYHEYRDCLDQEWAVWLQKLGLLVSPVSNRLSSPAAFLCQLRPYAIILSGGNNLASDVYDGPARAEGVPDAFPERDATETALAQYAIEHQIPLLGCCRGMQFLQAFFGGRLCPLNDPRVAHVASTHAVELTDGPFQSLVGQETLTVNTFHDYGIAAHALAQPLHPLAISPMDQTVEAFVHRTLPVVGIMWHPERPNPAATADLKLAAALFASQWPQT